MTETKPNQVSKITEASKPRMYAPWMIGVLIVFAVCESLLISWGFEAFEYAVTGGFVVFLFVGLRSYRAYGSKRILETLVVLTILFLFFMLFTPTILACREAARRMMCINNLKTLGLGLNLYENTHGHFPPAFVPDENGKPMHSWRVAILPIIEQQAIYDRYDLDKPWDSPENQKVAESQIREFQCPSVPDRPENRADYVAVLGEDTFWRPDGVPRKKDEITKGLSNVVALIEINDSDIPWAEPRDVMLDDFLSGKISWLDSGVHGVRSAFYEYPRGRNVVFADGHVEFLIGDLPPDQLRRFFSITNPLDPEAEFPRPARRPIVFHHIVFYVWLATLFLQFIYLFFPARRVNKHG